MTIPYKSGRQEVISAEIDITLAMLETGVAIDAIQVPAGARLVGGDVTVTQVFNSTTSDTIKVGDAGDDDRYTASAINLQALGRTALTLTGYRHTTEQFVKALWTSGVGTPTTGAFTLSFQYVVQGRAAFSQGLDFRADGVRGA